MWQPAVALVKCCSLQMQHNQEVSSSEIGCRNCAGQEAELYFAESALGCAKDARELLDCSRELLPKQQRQKLWLLSAAQFT